LSNGVRVGAVVKSRYISSSSIGLFGQPNAGYGERKYELGGRTAVSRSTTAEAVLESIYEVAGVVPPAEDAAVFRGHPLAATPRWAALIFYAVWPAAVVIAGV